MLPKNKAQNREVTDQTVALFMITNGKIRSDLSSYIIIPYTLFILLIFNITYFLIGQAIRVKYWDYIQRSESQPCSNCKNYSCLVKGWNSDLIILFWNNSTSTFLCVKKIKNLNEESVHLIQKVNCISMDAFKILQTTFQCICMPLRASYSWQYIKIYARWKLY